MQENKNSKCFHALSARNVSRLYLSKAARKLLESHNKNQLVSIFIQTRTHVNLYLKLKVHRVQQLKL